jgi:fucose permease
MIAQALVTCGYIPIVCTAPFPAIIASFFFLGLGIAINLAMGNVFCANLYNGTNMLGVMHGSYGLGGTIGLLIATTMVTSGGLLFSQYYLLTLFIAFFNLCFAGWSFWHYEAESGQNLLTAVEQTASRTQNSAGAIVKRESHIKEQIANLAKAFKSKTVILGALFIFVYQGAEVSISGCK